MGPNSSILVMTAVVPEMEAVQRGVGNREGIDVLAAGVGPIAAAAATVKALAKTDYRLVISAGIGGGFSGKAEVGSLAVANEIIAADLGVETADGFSSLEELGFGFNTIKTEASLVNRVSEALVAAGLSVITGPIITVSTATGTGSGTEKLTRRVPGVVAEAMEGYGVAFAAYSFGVPVLEIRAISNLVGPRDRNAWRVAEALGILEKAFSELLEVLI